MNISIKMNLPKINLISKNMTILEVIQIHLLQQLNMLKNMKYIQKRCIQLLKEKKN